MALTAHKTVTMFMRYVHTEDDPVRAAAELVASRRKTVVGSRPITPPMSPRLSLTVLTPRHTVPSVTARGKTARFLPAASGPPALRPRRPCHDRPTAFSRDLAGLEVCEI